MEIFLDCPECDGRLVFRGARGVGQVRVGLQGRCPACGAAFSLVGGQLRAEGAEQQRHPA